jgi:hypothetical protein
MFRLDRTASEGTPDDPTETAGAPHLDAGSLHVIQVDLEGREPSVEVRYDPTVYSERAVAEHLVAQGLPILEAVPEKVPALAATRVLWSARRES